MKLQIEVELPEDIAKVWEVVRVGVPVDGEYVITSFGKTSGYVAAFDHKDHDAIPRAILRRKLNPRDWWPKWLLADTITLEINAVIKVRENNGNIAYWHDESSLLDFSWIPKHLRRSGKTIKNPWKGEQQ